MLTMLHHAIDPSVQSHNNDVSARTFVMLSFLEHLHELLCVHMPGYPLCRQLYVGLLSADLEPGLLEELKLRFW
jgi:hypothetical protein